MNRLTLVARLVHGGYTHTECKGKHASIVMAYADRSSDTRPGQYRGRVRGLPDGVVAVVCDDVAVVRQGRIGTRLLRRTVGNSRGTRVVERTCHPATGTEAVLPSF